MFTNDLFPRALTPDGAAADRCRLDAGADARRAPAPRSAATPTILAGRDDRRAARWSAPAPSSRSDVPAFAIVAGVPARVVGDVRATQRSRTTAAPEATDSKEHVIRLGVVGYGYWGPNLVRNFAEAPGCQLAAVSDMRPERLAQVRTPLSGGAHLRRPERDDRRSADRRRRDRHAGVHALRPGDAGAARRQARAGREADRRDRGSGGAAGRRGGEAPPGAQRRPHVRLQRRGPQDQGDRRPASSATSTTTTPSA